MDALKKVRAKSGLEYDAIPSRSELFACAGCGAGLGPGRYYVVCSDCGGMFCEDCVADGTFEDHECDDSDEEP